MLLQYKQALSRVRSELEINPNKEFFPFREDEFLTGIALEALLSDNIIGIGMEGFNDKLYAHLPISTYDM